MTQALPSEWIRPPAEFSLAPFWFWNDELDETELSRQLDEFQSHGIDAFVIHPRLGLPEHLGWMSDGLLDKMRFVIEQAQARGIWVILYDEGMYPSGSSAGQVVAENPNYQCRGLVRIDLDAVIPNTVEQGVLIGADGELLLADNQSLVAEVNYEGTRYAIVDRRIDSVIRGLHYIDESVVDASGESLETSPPASDLLNPEAVACFIRLVYERYYREFGEYFGNVIQAIFTDEPDLLGRSREKNVIPGTTGILENVNEFLDYDFTPFLPALWDNHAPAHIRADYDRAIEHRFEETYYAQLYHWCESHGIALTGHPAEPDATRHLRYFHMPGQDIVWRYIERDQPSALEGRQSTQGKAASSMMYHGGQRRNVNEFCGAYGHGLTFEDMRWLANWLLIRGCNLLIPHAFYYSVRGPRKDERPPDVGLHSNWWGEQFTAYANACRRLCWLNTDSEHVCHVAILGEHQKLPWRAAKACFQNQIDFNYLDVADLDQCQITEDRKLSITGQSYSVVIVDSEFDDAIQQAIKTLSSALPVIYWQDDDTPLIEQLKGMLPNLPFSVDGADGLRVRQVRKAGCDWVVLFNEGNEEILIEMAQTRNRYLLNPTTETAKPITSQWRLKGYHMLVLMETGEGLESLL